MPLLVTPDRKNKTESICESGGIKLRSSQELDVNQPLSVCKSVFCCQNLSVCVSVCRAQDCTPTKHACLFFFNLLVGEGDPNSVVFVCNPQNGGKPFMHQSHSATATKHGQEIKRATIF